MALSRLKHFLKSQIYSSTTKLYLFDIFLFIYFSPIILDYLFHQSCQDWWDNHHHLHNQWSSKSQRKINLVYIRIKLHEIQPTLILLWLHNFIIILFWNFWSTLMRKVLSLFLYCVNIINFQIFSEIFIFY